MARFHVGRGGKSAVCSAKKGNCPFGGEDAHYSSREEAQSAAEKKMGDEFSPTASKQRSKVSAAKVTKPAFSIPEGETGEGYMGGGSWVGGNLIRMQEERKSRGDSSYIDNKEIVGEIRKDIKKAVEAGYLPSHLNGNPIKYTVSADRSGGSAIYATARVVGASTLDISSFTEDRRSWDYNSFVTMTQGNKETAELGQKLTDIQNSYRYDSSNSMVDYFDTNFYPRTKIIADGDFDNVHKAEMKVNRLMIDMAKNNELDLSKDPAEIMTEAARKNPKVRDAMVEHRAMSTHYRSAREMSSSSIEENKSLGLKLRVNGDSYPSQNDIDNVINKLEKEKAARISAANLEIKIASQKAKTDPNVTVMDIMGANQDSSSVQRRFRASLERARLIR